MLKTDIEVAKTIKNYMSLLNISSMDIISKLDSPLSESALSRYLNGSRRLPYNIIGQIANALNVPAEKLIFKNSLPDVPKEKYTEINYFDIRDNTEFSYKKANIFDMNIGERLLIPNQTLGDYVGVKDICIFKMNASSLDHIMPNTVTVAVKQVKMEDLRDSDIVVFQNCHGLDIRLFFNDKKAKIISFVPRTTDKTKERFNYLYKDAWHFNIIGKVVLHTTQTKNPMDE